MRVVALGALLAFAAAGCERGCARRWVERHAGRDTGMAPPASPFEGTDCPDGLARCDDGTVRVSRLAFVPRDCFRGRGPEESQGGPEGACQCPWVAVAACPLRCAADGVELAVEAPSAARQLCAPDPDAGVVVTPASPSGVASGHTTPCDEGEAFRCVAGDVVTCSDRHVLGRCARGCFRDRAALGEDEVSHSERSLQREAVFALLCAR